ncbi:NADH:flavin oxidoreductase/NADH oxidase [Arthrobacter sp. I2-34]|uniref:NADH:flavin oxidoreductase/NADH oxidase n=1 Tax=Arthrobacter hankyongi TaxID=2904801 RepID=A0ABS9LBG1_9MICC|nr:NADH:flavin oxidoreductase/NADH oxidase [Arthrobacter hankyongi]MCG2624010.1 NADH:flavin oxidoreductase/NADH oxidase [Arthrobacter hankyongi]
MAAPGLFDPLELRGLPLAHRGWVAPMCQYSVDPAAGAGVPNDWHLMHLGQFAAGGAALILTEATAVSAEGRISPRDTGLWTDGQAQAWSRIVGFVHRHGPVGTRIGVQLAHAGRKASTYWPFAAERGSVAPADGGWQTVGPTTEPFGDYAAPAALDEAGLLAVVADFRAAAERAVQAGFDAVEIHAAHGYLLHQFLSPLVNTRRDGWGGTAANRSRLVLAVVAAVRSAIPDAMPLLLRVSASDWVPGGLEPADLAGLAVRARDAGVDLIDVSSGGAVAGAQIPLGPGYQVPFAAEIRRESGLPVGAVGLISRPAHAQRIIAEGSADAVLIARAALRDPHWWLRAGVDLGAKVPWPPQYERAAVTEDY